MANTEPTGGPSAVDRMMIDPSINDDQAKYDKALEDAFGPQARGDRGGDGEGTDDAGGVVPPLDPEGAETDPNAGASAEGEEEGGEEGEQTSGAIGGDAADFATLFRNRYNRDPEPGELEGYIALAEWAAQITPQQRAAMEQAMANPEMYLNPEYRQQYAQPQGQPTTSTPIEDSEYAALVEEFGEDHPLVKKLRNMEASQQQSATINLQQQQERTLQHIGMGVNAFKSRYEDISDVELDQLQGAVAQSRIFPGFVNAHGGDVARAMDAALDYAYWQNPTFRQRETEKQFAAMEETKKQETTRKAKASSVSGSGGNGASRTAPPPKTNDDRWAAVAAGLGEAMNNGQPGN